MSIWVQILLFAIPGITIYYGVFYGTPKLVSKGIPLIYSFWLWLWIPALLLLPLSIGLYSVLEDGVLTIEAINQRFRLNPISRVDWLWIVLAVILTIVFDQLLEPVGKVLAKYKLFSPPSYLPEPFNPLKNSIFPRKSFWCHTKR